MTPAAEAALSRLRSFYRSPLYLRWFTAIRLGHSGYDIVEGHLPRAGRILDLGCGYGHFSNFAALMSPEREVTGIELNVRKLRYADKDLPRVAFKQGSALELAGGHYDGIVLLHVLHHLGSYSEQERLLRWCVENLAPEGRLLVLEVDDRPWWKFIVAHIVDHGLYPGDGIYFRNRAAYLGLFGRLGLDCDVVPMESGRPFPHILYVCRKKA
ncbi:MAG: class I SAM-dependent methyltransferase [Elusimicrobiota bacterium]|jgi:2-polyprenyl-3-methyl-5-hydroxy-6-metoxy-1,4-benzoquinol methylase